MTDIDSINWNRCFVDLANQFEEENSDTDWSNDDYFATIESYVNAKFLEFVGVKE